MAQSKEELEEVFSPLQANLPEKYFERVLTDLFPIFNPEYFCPFIGQLSVNDRLQLARWFIEEKKRTLVAFSLLKLCVFTQPGVDREQSRNLLQQMRQSDDLSLRQQTMADIVPWNEERADDDGSVETDD
jgi:hypothetical protein